MEKIFKEGFDNLVNLGLAQLNHLKSIDEKMSAIEVNTSIHSIDLKKLISDVERLKEKAGIK